MKATADTNANVAEAKRRLRGALDNLQQARSELLGISRFLRADPTCQESHRLQGAGDVSARSVAYSIEQACSEAAEDLPRDVIAPLERELRLTKSQCARMEAQHRRMMERVHRRLWNMESSDNWRKLQRAA